MPNIRIDLESPVYNGREVTFKSPSDCSNVEGLIIYYSENGKDTFNTFEFADAHGNNVGSIDLFASDVLVRVILDTELNRAYVQNADTNSYLEDRFSLSEYMYTYNDFFSPICTDDGKSFVIVDDDGNVIVADWKFITEPLVEEEEDPTVILVDKSTGCMYRKFGGKIEWFNPPMILGVEYRTTERYRNKPVYQKLIDFGALPNKTQKSVSIFASGEENTMDCGIDMKIISYNNQAYKQLDYVTVQVLQNGEVTLKTNYDESSVSVYVLCYYTKTAD